MKCVYVAGILVVAIGGFVFFQRDRRESQSALNGAAVTSMRTVKMPVLDPAPMIQLPPATTVEVAAPKARPTRTEVSQRWEKVRKMVEARDFDNALNEYLWLFDEGMISLASFSGVRRTGLVKEIADLGKIHPPALSALRERIAVAAKILENSPGDEDALRDLTSLNRILGQPQRNVELYDQLSPGDPMRQKLSQLIFEPLVEAGRYRDAMTGTTYQRMNRLFDIQLAGGGKKEAIDAAAFQGWNDMIVSTTLKNIEALAGVGDVQHAEALARKLIGFSNTVQTMESLHVALHRAGRSEIFQRVSAQSAP